MPFVDLSRGNSVIQAGNEPLDQCQNGQQPKDVVCFETVEARGECLGQEIRVEESKHEDGHQDRTFQDQLNVPLLITAAKHSHPGALL